MSDAGFHTNPEKLDALKLWHVPLKNGRPYLGLLSMFHSELCVNCKTTK